ncbi:MAG: hypothetical protein LWW85_00320 [Marinilabiliales bacterium]|nr:hypothetical protein [Marinilabiliales bacterium]
MILLNAQKAGISGDEEVHYLHSLKVYHYFATWGADQSAVNTPETHLQYYGQSFDNLTTLLAQWFHIDDIYTFRHLMNSLAGWLCIWLAAQFAVWLSGYGAGIVVLLLFSLSPTFLGHCQNNLKDIPFALAYLAGTYYLLRWLLEKKPGWRLTGLLILSLAFSISIRPGGLLLFCYLLFFFGIRVIWQWRAGTFVRSRFRQQGLQIFGILLAAYLAGILLWPYLLQHPFSGIWKSYQVMAHFPTTLRQLFEGRWEWSDLMPWYYLPKLMLITLPFTILAALLLFLARLKQILRKDSIRIGALIFTLLFPILFVILEKANLYGSWRHFLFVYPALVILAAIGIVSTFERLRTRLQKGILVTLLALLSIHPIDFMIRNHPYFYLYYNPLVGGLKGAYGHYETDYYYHSLREGTEWLQQYLKQNHGTETIQVATNFPANWFFRNNPKVSVRFVPYTLRSQQDWDYYIVVNSYVSPTLLQNKNWPPANTLHLIKADEVPICAILKRDDKSDLIAYQYLTENKLTESLKCFEKAIKNRCSDEVIFFNFATACYRNGDRSGAVTNLLEGLKINPDNEMLQMFLANIRIEMGETQAAADLYQRILSFNRKYFEAYPALAKIWIEGQKRQEARQLLKSCLMIHPGYKAAIQVLADSYRDTDPQVAIQYDELLKSMN